MFESLDLMMELISIVLWDRGYIHHFVFGMGFGVAFFFKYFWSHRIQKRLLFIMLCVPVMIESIQYFMPDRSCDFFDAFSSWMGILLVYWAAREHMILKRRRCKM
jgi:glycopeptide antibiotics resistance protein